MKPRFRNLFLLPAVIAGFGLISADRSTAQTFTTLHSFTAITNSANSDGANPWAALVLSGNTLYGTTTSGGDWNGGTLFKVGTDGTGFMNLHSLTGTDGAYPFGALIITGNILYGTAAYGGNFDGGTIFRINTDGTGHTILHRLTGNDGVNPFGALIIAGDTLYGTAGFGGDGANSGTVFAVNTDGMGFTTLHSFPGYTGLGNSDGAFPYTALVLSGNMLYGTANQGGDGTVGVGIGSGTLFGGATGEGTLFSITTNGTDFTALYNFTGVSDGANPHSELLLSGNRLYGTTRAGGSANKGIVFAINTDGTGFTNLHNFAATSGPLNSNSDGASPSGGLVLSGNTLYGTASAGGSAGNGTVFSISFAPQLTINLSGSDVILTWPTNVAGFDYTGYILQSTTNLIAPVFWNTNSLTPVIVNGQNTVTNAIAGTQKYFRLNQ